jgi:hypothetical protein
MGLVPRGFVQRLVWHMVLALLPTALGIIQDYLKGLKDLILLSMFAERL